MTEPNPPESAFKQLLDQMVAAKRLSAADAATLLRESARGTQPAPQAEEDVLRWLAAEYDLGFTTLDDIEPDRQLLSLFPARILLKEELLPLRRLNGTVEVATSRLFATQGLDALKTLTGLNLKPVLASSEAIQREMKKRLGVGADTIDTLDEETALQVVDDDAQEDTNLDGAAEDASIIRFVNQVLRDAIELRASDIHLEPFEDELRIRYRIDGVLQEIPVPAQIKRFQPAIVSRVKILSHLNIAEKRLPQDGRIKIRLDQSEVDIRVSVIPMLHGEAVVLRLLRQNATLLGMTELGMDQRELRSFRRVLGLPHGIILVTGPTGSGKTTTLYTALNEINDSIRKIITIEDPIEYQLRGVNQIQVSEKAGLTFARGLRSILRHDPDVILIGEIRDKETAQIAVQASLTGHLVFSTLHTNDAPGAVTRLVDMGVEPYLVASSLEAVLAQRLVRVLCRHCRQPDTSPATQALKAQIDIPPQTTVYRAVGCRECRQTGYHGRHAIFEWMDIDSELRQMVLENRSSGEICAAARRNGLRVLSEDGWRLVRAGVTTPEEVLRVTKD
ncbi:MAG: type II/IV secretion system protein, partial [Verrucomicrobia bacterium]|nr:type II/IV secretion system protein [Verrucomicrobiota bacterium]